MSETPGNGTDLDGNSIVPGIESPVLEPVTLTVERHDIDGHVVVIQTELGRQDLWIDNVYQPYFVTRSGYTLKKNRFEPPHASLLEGAEIYIRTYEEIERDGTLRLPVVAPDPALIAEVINPRTDCKRSNFVDLTPTQRTRLAAALNDAYDRGVVESFAEEHNDNWFNIHFGPAFLPWHRHFLLRFERELQRFDSRVSLPYWNWTQNDSADLEESSVWKPFFGGRANRGGMFDHWRLNRGNRPVGSLPSLASVVNVVQSKTFRALSNIECMSHHGGVHQWVGGDMNSGRSPRDPLFYLHHGNIDRIWAMWQRNHRDAAQYSSDSTIMGCWSSPAAFVDLNDQMASGATPSSMIDHMDLGYFYGKDESLDAQLPSFETGDIGSRIIAPKSIGFGSVIVGDMKGRTLAIQVSGPGQREVSIQGSSPEQRPFIWNALEARIDACGRRDVFVRFSPRGEGVVDQFINIVSNVTGSQSQTTTSVKLSGSGKEGAIP